MYLAVGLAYAVECACHEGVILNGIAEYYQLCRSDTVAVCGLYRSFLDYLTHELYSVHVDTRLCGADIYG